MFMPGCKPGPGRPQGSVTGRREALLVLDEMLSDQKNKDALQTALQAEFSKNPVRFFARFVMPLLPNESKVSVAGDGVVKWQSLLETFPVQPGDADLVRGDTKPTTKPPHRPQIRP